jgi:hypothetical protein
MSTEMGVGDTHGPRRETMPRQRQLNLAVGFNPRIRGGNPRITSPPIVSRRVATDECHRQGASDTSRNPCRRDACAPKSCGLKPIMG